MHQPSRLLDWTHRTWLTGVIVAFLVVSAASVYWLQRRRVEIRQMATRGIGVSALTARTWIEIALPAAAAAAAGWVLAWAALDAIGPGGVVSPTARALAGRHLVQSTAREVEALNERPRARRYK